MKSKLDLKGVSKTTFSLCEFIFKKLGNGEKMNLQVGGPTNTIVLTENRTGVTLIMDLTLYQRMLKI